MENSVNRIMVNTIVKKAIHDLKADPERTIRNLVDMALKFADTRFQTQFYSAAQKLLSNEDSGYYSMVKDTLSKINEENLLTFSMNLGYNGLYDGSNTIRTVKQTQHYDVPWTISLTIAEERVFDHHHDAIRQGESLGIYTWHLFSDHSIYECLGIAADHPDSAFVIFCGRHELDWNVLDYADDIPNIALVIPFDKDADVNCEMLRASGILYGLSYTYSETDIGRIESGELLHDMEQLHPTVCIFKPQSLGQKALQDRVYHWIDQARIQQQFHTIPWELYRDMMLVDEIISGEPCWVGFDRHGQLSTQNGVNEEYGLNIFKNELTEVLKQAFPVQKGL